MEQCEMQFVRNTWSKQVHGGKIGLYYDADFLFETWNGHPTFCASRPRARSLNKHRSHDKRFYLWALSECHVAHDHIDGINGTFLKMLRIPDCMFFGSIQYNCSCHRVGGWNRIKEREIACEGSVVCGTVVWAHTMCSLCVECVWIFWAGGWWWWW